MELTPTGVTVYNELREEARRYDREISNQMSAEERAVLKKLLLRLSGA